jgi:phage internal scaffolding protein
MKIRKERKRAKIMFKDKSRTQQNFKEKQDVNRILAKYKKTGIINSINGGEALYGDFSKVSNFQDALELVQNATDEFMEIPAQVRAKFDNDPAKLLDFMDDESNHDKARDMGLLPQLPPKPSEESPSVSAVVNKPQSASQTNSKEE